jgi:hypothetical protein
MSHHKDDSAEFDMAAEWRRRRKSVLRKIRRRQKRGYRRERKIAMTRHLIEKGLL